MAKPSSYEAAQDQADKDWFTKYRAAQAARGGQSTINGVSADEALGRPVVAGPPVAPVAGGNTESFVQQTPYGQVSAMRSPVMTPNAAVAQGDVFANAVEQIGANRLVEQQAQQNAGRDRYNDFLRAAGIDPNTIGGAKLTGTMGDRGLANPSLVQQEDAVNEANKSRALEGQGRIAARRAYQRGDAQTWADIVGAANQRRDLSGGSSSERQKNFWLNRLLGAEAVRTAAFPSNGY